MKMTLTNDTDRPIYMTFSDGGDYDMVPNKEIVFELREGSQLKMTGEYLETKNIDRP
jgi:hypothetical protein